MNKKLMQSGEILYLREHTKEMRSLKFAIYFILLIILVFGIIAIKLRTIAYPVAVIRANTAALNEYNAIQGRCQIWKDMMAIQTENLEQCREFNQYYADNKTICQNLPNDYVGLYKEIK